MIKFLRKKLGIINVLEFVNTLASNVTRLIHGVSELSQHLSTFKQQSKENNKEMYANIVNFTSALAIASNVKPNKLAKLLVNKNAISDYVNILNEEIDSEIAKEVSDSQKENILPVKSVSKNKPKVKDTKAKKKTKNKK